jgi:mRNA interferase MazF
MASTIRRGDIVFASLDPAVGSESAKTRPVVVVSNDAANSSSPLITIVPLTSRMTPLFDFQVALPAEETGLSRDGRAQCEQVRAISVRRVAGTVGRLPRERLAEVDEALRLHLDL